MTVERIEEKRREMIKLAADYGFTSLLTVQASQELDSLLNAITNKRKSEYFLLKKVYSDF
ncbi:aspartyl-phosphate phosphatase Spo0E family protein [Peribacillus butanolivorans]|uniref:Aspartyl-phosphate phosphatase Spo0E family protein n=1 Tax=Peribacillus butanolivorans TaxID=421767 RepID=A0ABM6XT46_9BACI|nr:aspartyl-phosphate phosphatase Spo0E family protein [Peribacillus butanolivorans]QNU07316.1 aspartyl-phosphate phosphatase Spo0E family protein [Peribacillus butanolivorans]